jgi:hypothetical protein
MLEWMENPITAKRLAGLNAALNDGLPTGWTAFTNEENGDVYYIHAETGERTMIRPVNEVVIEREVVVEKEVGADSLRYLVEENRQLKKQAAQSKEAAQLKFNMDKRKKSVAFAFNGADKRPSVKAGAGGMTSTPDSASRVSSGGNGFLMNVMGRSSPARPPEGPGRQGSGGLESALAGLDNETTL